MGLKKVVKKTICGTKSAVHMTTNFVGITCDFKKSRYDYPLLKFYFWFLFYVFISVISLFTLLPFAYYLYSKKKVDHSFYDNKKLRFSGTINGAYASFIQGFLLVIIILATVDKLQHTFLYDILVENIPERFVGWIVTGINALPTILASSLIFNGLFKWQQSNTHFCYQNGGSFMEIRIFRGVLVALVGKLVSLISLGLGNPISVWYKQRFIVNREHFSYEKMKFDGNVLQSYKWFLWRYYLQAISLGLYYPVYLHKINQWTIMHSHLSK